MSQLDWTNGGGARGEGPRVFTVGELVRAADRVLAQRFSAVWVEGEVSGLKLAHSGHAYFSLIEDGACLPVAMWRSSVQRLRFRLEDGQTLRVCGRLGLYDRQGRFQMYADRAEPAGLGALMLQLEQLKAKLRGEGLFEDGRKRPLPRSPRVIGVVTSARGAAIHDILEVARQRCPSRVLLSPAVVQGDEAARSIVRALVRLQRFPEVDVIIVGRGGGAAEDLWAFNDERLARAVAACPVPVVSAVGHEVDFTLCDLVADVRAATPSHAAELVVPDQKAWRAALLEARRRLSRQLQRRLLDERARFEQLAHRLRSCGRALGHIQRHRLAHLKAELHHRHPRVRLHGDRRRLDGLHARLVQRGSDLTRAARVRLAKAAGALEALSPLAVLERGYALATTIEGSVVRDARQLRPKDRLALRFHRGRVDAEVVSSDVDED